MERVVRADYKAKSVPPKHRLNVVVGRPPWTEFKRTGKLERLILQLGAGRGYFSELSGIPRSMGCIGNNRFLLRRSPLTMEEVERILDEFESAGGREVWITNYDDLRDVLHAARYAKDVGIVNVYAVVLLEDFDRIPKSGLNGVNVIVEMPYSEENMRRLESLEGEVYGVLIVSDVQSYSKISMENVDFSGEVLVDILYPPNVKLLDESFLSFKMLPVSHRGRHPCMSGMIAVTGDGYVVPCPLIRGYVVGDLRKESLTKVIRKRRLRAFWKILNEIDECSNCPLMGLCHDCRAINYQITGDVFGVEYCGREILKAQDSYEL
ncbi:MAG: SPASM domain-containing protein [Thermococci archaeon]|nr:SPASM domain-containing protein [Thermococci archaeon]